MPHSFIRERSTAFLCLMRPLCFIALSPNPKNLGAYDEFAELLLKGSPAGIPPAMFHPPYLAPVVNCERQAASQNVAVPGFPTIPK